MSDTFTTSISLRTASLTNGIIYVLHHLPLIKKILPPDLYKNKGLKQFAFIIAIIKTIVGIFFGKAFYVGVMIFLPSFLFSLEGTNPFIYLFIFFTLIGGLIHLPLFQISKDRYYAVVLMRMDAKKYELCDFFTEIAKTFIGLFPLTLLFGLLLNVPWYYCILLPIFVIMVKLSCSAFALSQPRRKINGAICVILAALILITGTILLFMGVTFPNYTLIILMGILLIPSILSVFYLLNYPNYQTKYTRILRDCQGLEEKDGVEIQTKNLKKAINKKAKVDSSLKGYRYFNQLFMRRHSKLLTRFTKIFSVILLVVFSALAIWMKLNPEDSSELGKVILEKMPYFLFIMYLFNSGKNITKAMFVNCDCSMLQYRFYREPKTVLLLFWERLKYLVGINIIPAILLALGLPLLVYLSGGTTIINYVLMSVSIISMSVFFSVHNLVLYYLLQPYTLDITIKSPLYSAISGGTYFICYLSINWKMTIQTFGITISVFCILYIVISLFLAYRFAPKTFKIRRD